MILDRLLDLRERLPDDAFIPEAHKKQKVRWQLNVSADGHFTGFVETGAKKKDWKEEVAPYLKRTSATRALLLVDKPDYVIGMVEDGRDGARSAERRDAYLALLHDAAKATGDETLAILADALSDDAKLAAMRADLTKRGWNPGDLVAPAIAGIMPHRNAAVQRFWIERQEANAADKSGMTAACLACGEERPITRTHPVELQVGPERVGMVTGNANAFLSHGLKQSEIAPLCLPCARGYGEALRYLLQSDAHRLRLSDLTWVFWTKEPSASFAFGRYFSDPQPADVQRLLTAPFSGVEADADRNAFHALVLAANKSRLVVRDWLDLPLSEVEASLRTYFVRQQMADYTGAVPPLKLIALAGATVRDLNELQPRTTEALLRHALTGQPLPLELLHQAVQRARAEREHVVTRPRAALLRLVLTSLAHEHNRSDLMTDDSLDDNHISPAYHAGRLLSLLSDLQDAAIGANATLVDRFYGAASTSPASVFGTLLAKHVPHLSKLRRDKSRTGLAYFFEREITKVMQHFDPEDGFPKTLKPEEQGLFAIGFYHQKYRPKKSEQDDAGGETEVNAPSEAAA